MLDVRLNNHNASRVLQGKFNIQKKEKAL